MTHAFNEHFTTMGMHTIVGTRLGYTTSSDPIIDDVLLSETTETEVEEIIIRLKNSDTLGVDGCAVDKFAEALRSDECSSIYCQSS
jgi:hypothetical protein